MTETEKVIIDEILKNTDPSKVTSDTAQKLTASLKTFFAEIKSLDDVSKDFIEHSALQTFISKESILSINKNNLYNLLCLQTMDYMHNKSEDKLKNIQINLENYLIKNNYIKTDQKNLKDGQKTAGMAMLPDELHDAQLIKHILLTEDEKLSRLFLDYLPMPKSHVFKGNVLPKMVAETMQDSLITIKAIVNKKNIEKHTIHLQRTFRKKRRMKEETQRIANRYASTAEKDKKTAEKDQKYASPQEAAKELIKNANTPYTPQCDPDLAKRLTETVKEIKLFSTVKHLTSPKAIESIFNDCLYGRRTLLEFYLPFKEAALGDSDIDQGDGNVICLGANKIDPQAKNGIELEFDADKIAKNNPCVFYKQRDLGYDTREKYSVKIGELRLVFSHTQTMRNQPNTSAFRIFGKKNSTSTVLADLLIAYNIKEMHQILTLNFFRFIDNLKDEENLKDEKRIKEIYTAFSQLNEKQLLTTLKEIGEHLTDSMEFNIYGAYKIDFSALKTIKIDQQLDELDEEENKESRYYVLDLPSLISELTIGKLNLLNEAIEKIPEIFTSYRFIDYLISSTQNEIAIDALQKQRSECSLPFWSEEKTLRSP